ACRPNGRVEVRGRGAATEQLELGLHRVFQPADSRAERAWPVRFRSYAARLVALAQTAAIGLFMFRGTQMYATNGYVTWSGSSGWWIIETMESFNVRGENGDQSFFLQCFTFGAVGVINYYWKT